MPTMRLYPASFRSPKSPFARLRPPPRLKVVVDWADVVSGTASAKENAIAAAAARDTKDIVGSRLESRGRAIRFLCQALVMEITLVLRRAQLPNIILTHENN